MSKGKVINLYAGPGTGKSTTAAALFAELKYRGVNCEYISEYAKDITWEKRGPKIWECPDYIFAKQHFRIARTIEDVELVITDSPLMLSLIYTAKDHYLYPSLSKMVLDAYNRYDNFDVFIERAPFKYKSYNPKGRNQTEEESLQKDREIRLMLGDQIGNLTDKGFSAMPFSRRLPLDIIALLKSYKNWNIPDAT